MIIEYIPFIFLWPWKSIAPIAGAVLILAIYIAWLVMPNGGQARELRTLLIAISAFLFVDAAHARLANQLGRGNPTNIASSGFATVLRPSINHLVNQFAERPVSAERLSHRTLFALYSNQKIIPNRILSISLESLGYYRDLRQRRDLERALLAKLSSDYQLVESRPQSSYGATLAGEARELCGFRLDGVPAQGPALGIFDNCLPALLARHGYHTSAWHGNDRRFYNRHLIYPRMGFSELHFFSELRSQVREPCSLLFVGICDRDVVRLALESFGLYPKEFVHVMTLDTHLPLQSTVSGCERATESELCTYRVRIANSVGALGDAVLAARVKPDAIVIYGDHGPPFVDGRMRAQFDSGAVPFWVFKRHNDAPESLAAN